MTLHNFLKIYGGVSAKEGLYEGNHYISIKRYCEEAGQEEVMTSDWYKNIKNRKIKRWQTIGGGAYNVEICIDLED